MKGLELARKYYETYIEQLLEAVPKARGRIAAGLVGEGSQCFGFDDELSQDHDFGPGFCIWLTDEDYQQFGPALQAAYDQLPKTFLGFSRDNLQTADRLGVMTIGSFYHRFTGFAGGVPKTLPDWLFTPEYHLAAATNGEVFCDDVGEFTSIRKKLLQFYPEDIRRKKIAARAAVMSQAGQYNLLRLIWRNDMAGVLQALGKFTEAAISMQFLLRCQYAPFYKWAFQGLSSNPSEHTEELTLLLTRLAEIPALMVNAEEQKAYDLAFFLTEEICRITVVQLQTQGLSMVESLFLQDHLGEIMDGIMHEQIRKLPPMLDC